MLVTAFIVGLNFNFELYSGLARRHSRWLAGFTELREEVMLIWAHPWHPQGFQTMLN